MIVGRPNDSGKIRLVTSAEVGDGVKHEFDAPTEKTRLAPGTPKWANYVKGVIEHFPGMTENTAFCIIL